MILCFLVCSINGWLILLHASEPQKRPTFNHLTVDDAWWWDSCVLQACSMDETDDEAAAVQLQGAKSLVWRERWWKLHYD